MRTSIPGRSNRPPVAAGTVSGFTLIELVVVMSLISLLLFFSMPRLQSAVITDPGQSASQWIVGTVQSLKERSLRERKVYTLHIGLDTQRLWVTHAGMNEMETAEAEQQAHALPEQVRIMDVEVPEQGRLTIGTVDLYFTDKGYSDKAVIHLQDDRRRRWSLVIEPFLPRVSVTEADVHIGT